MLILTVLTDYRLVIIVTVLDGNTADTEGRRPNDFLGLSLNDRTILFPVILLDKTVSVG